MTGINGELWSNNYRKSEVFTSPLFSARGIWFGFAMVAAEPVMVNRTKKCSFRIPLCAIAHRSCKIKNQVQWSVWRYCH